MATVDPPNIRLRKAAEDRIAGIQKIQAEMQRTSVYSKLEQSSNRIQRQRMATHKLQAAKNALEEDLNRRRKKLAQLLSAEQEAYQKEIEAQYEAPDATKQRMLDYARELQRQREEARQRTVEEKEKQRWRNSSDVLRARDQKIVQMRIADERADQLEEKQRRAAAEAAWHSHMDAAMLQANQAGADREAKEAARRKQMDDEMRRMLETQTAMKAGIAQRTRAQQIAHEQRLLAEWDAENTAQEQREVARRAAARADMKRAMEFNAKERGRAGRALAVEKATDEARLQAVMAAEKAEEEQEARRVEAARRGARAHRAQLEAQMSIAKAEEGALDALHAAEQERMWRQREARWEQEAAARDALNHEVKATRDVQVQQRREAKEFDRWLDERQLAADEEHRQQGLARERALEEARQGKLRQQAAYTQQQMEEGEALRAQARQAEFLEARLQQREETRYQARVAEMLAEPPANTRWNRKKMNFY